MKKLKLNCCLYIAFTILGSQVAYSQTSKALVVIVKYKSIVGKDSVALAVLQQLIAKVKKEPHYIDIWMHVDPADKSNILLYEKWSDEAYYKGEHLTTPHLQQFMQEARSFLTGPPEITFWDIIN